MKALPLWQPWATLIALEAKRIETRHWPAPAALVGQRFAIYATRTCRIRICDEHPFAQYVPDPRALPLSSFIATAVLDRCVEMTAEGILRLRQEKPEEYEFGHYQIGRFAWVLRDVEQLPEPIPYAWPYKTAAKFIDVPPGAIA